MPMPQVVECLDVLSPVLTRMLTPSSETGCFPDNWKQADIHPRLKKPRAEVMFNNLRPINNLSFVSKLVEQAIFSQTLDYLTLYELYPKAQPRYCEFHSTETVLVQFMTSCSLWTSSESLSSYYLTSVQPLIPLATHFYLTVYTPTLISGGMHTPWSSPTSTTDSNPYLFTAEYRRGLRQSMAFHKDLVLVPFYLSSMQARCSWLWNVTYLMSMHMLMSHSCKSPSMPTLLRSNEQLWRTCKNVLLTSEIGCYLTGLN